MCHPPSFFLPLPLAFTLCVLFACMQMHAIATFNTLVQEGRRVAAGLISRSPVSRDDACLYTPDWTDRETDDDKRLKEALRRDSYGGEGGGQKLITGSTDDTSIANKNVVDISAAAGSKRIVEEAVALAQQYGYPGALQSDAVDVSLELTEAQRQERAWRRASDGGRGDKGRLGGRAPRRSDDASLAEEEKARRNGR